MSKTIAFTLMVVSAFGSVVFGLHFFYNIFLYGIIKGDIVLFTILNLASLYIGVKYFNGDYV